MEKWKSGKVEKWKSGKVEKWKSGKVEIAEMGDVIVESCAVSRIGGYLYVEVKVKCLEGASWMRCVTSHGNEQECSFVWIVDGTWNVETEWKR